MTEPEPPDLPLVTLDATPLIKGCAKCGERRTEWLSPYLGRLCGPCADELGVTREEWRPVVGYEGRYEVSNRGRVRSLDWSYERPISKAPHRLQTVHIRGRIRKQYRLKRGGYLAVSLCRNDRSVSRPVHVLVAAAFLGPRPEGQQVRHLDGDKNNCRVENLAYGTPLENHADMRRHGTHHNTRKTHCPARHPYDDKNTYVSPSGGRYCIACRRARQGVAA